MDETEFSHRVYNALDRLQKEGLIENTVVPAKDLIKKFEPTVTVIALSEEDRNLLRLIAHRS